MRTAWLIALALAASSELAAQTPAFEVRGVVFGLLGKRDAETSPTTLGQSTGTLTGGELSLRGRSIGVLVRLVNGDLSASGSGGIGGRLTTGEVRLQAGPRALAAEVGYGKRATGGTLGATVYSYLRAGVSSVLDIGGTGLTARISAAAYLKGQEASVSGHEVATALEYRLRRTPFVVTLGYRAEVFRATAGATERAEKVSGVVAGVGIRFAR
jgi:hypothetical protein